MLYDISRRVLVIQIIGTKKSKDTQKAIRLCLEARIEYQFVNLKERDLSKREWESIISSVSDKKDLIDTSSDYYKKQGYSYRDYDPVEEVIMHPELLVLPVLRRKNKVVLGFDSAFIKEKE